MQKENARERIVQACLELLKTTSLEALRTQDLMEKAKVSRSTFYRLFPDTRKTFHKTQISFASRYIYACVSFQRVKRKAEMPDPFLTVTLGLPFPLESDRVAVKSEPYPGRWTTHIVIGRIDEIDDELTAWLKDAYAFSKRK